MTDHPKATVTPTTLADHVDLLDAVRAARGEVERVRQLRVSRQAGHADLCRAQLQHCLALQRARDTGLIVDRFTVDTAALLHHQDPGDGTVGVSL